MLWQDHFKWSNNRIKKGFSRAISFEESEWYGVLAALGVGASQGRNTSWPGNSPSLWFSTEVKQGSYLPSIREWHSHSTCHTALGPRGHLREDSVVQKSTRVDTCLALGHSQKSYHLSHWTEGNSEEEIWANLLTNSRQCLKIWSGGLFITINHRNIWNF